MARWKAGAILAGAALAVASPAAAWGVEVPKGKEVISLRLIEGKLGPVEFRHADHAVKYRMPGGAPVRCKDCHHTLASDEPSLPYPDMRCSGCHVKLGEPEKEFGGKRARVLARLKPDGVIDYRSILFHDYCRACHVKVPKGNYNLGGCRTCHPKGIDSSVIHGRYDSAPQDGTRLSWLRCAAGQRWDGARCEEQATAVARVKAGAACPDGYRLPSAAELSALAPCSRVAACGSLFGPDGGTYWTDGEDPVAVSLADGARRAGAGVAAVRCVRSDPRTRDRLSRRGGLRRTERGSMIVARGTFQEEARDSGNVAANDRFAVSAGVSRTRARP